MNRNPVMSDEAKAEYGDAPTTDVHAGQQVVKPRTTAAAKSAQEKPAAKESAAKSRDKK